MSEKERCISCPDRRHTSRLLARLIGREELPEGCEGPVLVSRGQIITQVRSGDEPPPLKDTWNSLIGSMDFHGERRYSRTDWTTSTVCGRGTIEPGADEISLTSSGSIVQTNEGGIRTAAFIKGSEQDITGYLRVSDTIKLLDATSELETAQKANDDAGIDRACDKIAQQGFALGAVAGRSILSDLQVQHPHAEPSKDR